MTQLILNRPLTLMQSRWFAIAFLCLGLMNVANAGYKESKEAFSKHDYKAAYDQCIHSANVGNPDCQNAIGYLVKYGYGVQANSDQAFNWFLQAANKKNVNAQYNLALMYGSADLSEYNLQQSAKWFLKAAEGNHVGAQINIGTIYAEGRGVEVNLEKSFYWWQKAAEQGNPMAQNNLGWAFMYGRGTEINSDLAIYWLERAAAQNSDADAKDLALKNLSKIRKTTPNQVGKDLRLKVDISEPDTDGKVVLTIQSIDRSPIKVMRVSGKDLGNSPAGSYKITRYVPIGESHIDVYAENKSGNKFIQQYTISRSGATSEISLPELDPSRIASAVKRDSVAIIIGVEQYESLPRSDFSNNDARNFYDYAGKALGVPATKIKLLSGSSAKRNDILMAIRNWVGAEVTAGKTDVYVFYSGHGLASPDGKKRYFLPIDTNVDLLEDTAISHEQFIKIVNSYQPKSLTILVDSCYSGTSRSGAQLLTAVRPIAIHSENENLPANATLISSSSGSQVSTSSSEVGHGLFSYFVMKGLEGDADINKDQKITAQELHTYVSERVTKEAQRRGVQQSPSLSGVSQKILVAQK